MFYIRKDSGNKKRIKLVESLADGLKEACEYDIPVALFYKYNERGVKVYTTSEKEVNYKLLIQDKDKKDEPRIIFTSNKLPEMYLKLNELELNDDFEGYIKFHDGVSEFLRIKGYSNYRCIVKKISKPLKTYLSSTNSENSKLKGLNIDESYDNNLDSLIHEDIIGTPYDILDNSTQYETICLDTIKQQELEIDLENDTSKEGITSSAPKYTEYNVVGVLKSGSLVHLNEKSTEYKEVLKKYTESKITGSDKYKEIRLNGYCDNGTSSARYKKKLEQNKLSYENISEFVDDLIERILYLDILKKDVLNAMAVEEKKGNLGYHILEASDFNLSNESFVNNLIEMKICADKRRDLKKSLSLLDSFSNKVSISENLDHQMKEQMKSIERASRKGLEKYKNKDIYDFIQEYDETEASLNENTFRKKKLTIRPSVIEGKVVVYKKSHL